MRILIAEDDLDISTLYKKTFEKRKHSVVLTFNGENCLQDYIDTFRSNSSKHKKSGGKSGSADVPNSSIYDVVILDYKMPGMNGMEVAKKILAVNPHQRIIFASAYMKETLQESVKQLKQVVELMQKPFYLRQLVDTIEDKQVYEELKKT
jgi:CheY-like chemotaxis protein